MNKWSPSYLNPVSSFSSAMQIICEGINLPRETGELKEPKGIGGGCREGGINIQAGKIDRVQWPSRGKQRPKLID